MYRIDNETASVTLPTPSPVGVKPNGYFTTGNGGDIPATIIDRDWANAVQEEISNVIEETDETLDKTDNTQLLTAINVLIAEAVVPIQAGISTSDTTVLMNNTYFEGISITPVENKLYLIKAYLPVYIVGSDSLTLGVSNSVSANTLSMVSGDLTINGQHYNVTSEAEGLEAVITIDLDEMDIGETYLATMTLIVSTVDDSPIIGYAQGFSLNKVLENSVIQITKLN